MSETPEDLNELNATIARVVFSHHVPPDWQRVGRLAVPRYSFRIGPAWTVVEKLAAEYPFALWELADTTWCCEIGPHQGFGDTAPLAICKAALAARRAAQPEGEGNAPPHR